MSYHLSKAVAAIENCNAPLSYDAWRRRIHIDAPCDWGSEPGLWEKSDLTKFELWMQRAKGCGTQKAESKRAVLHCAQKCSFDPLGQYMTSIVWDGKPRIDRFIKDYAGGVEKDCLGLGDKPGDADRYMSAIGRMWLISGAARALLWESGGCQVDTMLVLEGAQGAGKSTAFRILGGEFFRDTKIAIGTTEGARILQGAFVYEWGEMSAMSGRDIGDVKDYITRICDDYRHLYEEDITSHPRRCIFGGTTNSYEYLLDKSGARRFLCVRVGIPDIDALIRDRDQLWAEAVARFRDGEKWHVTDPVEAAIIQRHQGLRAVADLWELRIVELVEHLPEVSTEAIAIRLGLLTPDGIGKLSPGSTRRIAEIMPRLGFEGGGGIRVKYGTRRVRGYRRLAA